MREERVAEDVSPGPRTQLRMRHFINFRQSITTVIGVVLVSARCIIRKRWPSALTAYSSMSRFGVVSGDWKSAVGVRTPAPGPG